MHSILADPRFKTWAGKRFSNVFDRWQRLAYIVLALIMILPFIYIFWLSPIMTLNLLAFNILATVYFYIGALHEERSLYEEFGPEYEDYKKRVPMFLPRLKC
jgi:protein-S-isoprenylcysteine O-methyltransferase Ste14